MTETHRILELSIVSHCKARLAQLLRSLPTWLDQRGVAFEVVVVDYGCPERTAEYLAQHYPQVRVVRASAVDRPFHAAHSKNVAIAAAAADWVQVLDADVRLTRTTFVAESLALLKQPGVAGVAVRRPRHYAKTHRCNLEGLSGPVMMRKADWARVRGFDETFWELGYEDHDFARRLETLGELVEPPAGLNPQAHSNAMRLAFYASNTLRSQRQMRLAQRPHRQVNPRGFAEAQPYVE